MLTIFHARETTKLKIELRKKQLVKKLKKAYETDSK
jgi:hypothetical protein